MYFVSLKWVFENIDGVKEASETKDLHFGTIDTWLLHKLSGGKVHLAEGSNASATGLFDIFTNSYIGWVRFCYCTMCLCTPLVFTTLGLPKNFLMFKAQSAFNNFGPNVIADQFWLLRARKVCPQAHKAWYFHN